MATMIESLKQQHNELLVILEEIKTKSSNSEEKKQKLMEAKNVFLRHLALEDSKLYPVLERAANRNDKLKQTLDIFASEMKKITEQVNRFFVKLENAELDSVVFAREFGKLFALLKQRIRREETVIYEEYKKVHVHIL